nr:MAG TPA: hypothetical protein [Caudoviricetes sp.]
MDYSEEMLRLQAENKEHEAVLEKSHEIIKQALEIIMPEDKRSREVVGIAIATSVHHFCEDSYSMGYNDCLLDILREKEEVSAPIMFPTLKS